MQICQMNVLNNKINKFKYANVQPKFFFSVLDSYHIWGGIGFVF